MRIVRALCTVLGNLVYTALPKRRQIALDNLRHAFTGEKSETEISAIARQSCRSFLLTAAEVVKFRPTVPDIVSVERYGYEPAYLQQLFLKAKRIHDEARGCIFTTPHIGNWELLPYAAALVNLPLAIVARPLDNVYLHKLIFESRVFPGQLVIPKKNALIALQRLLRQGKSIGILPDQSTKRGISVDFFGRKATTTPAPALLAIHYNRPIVVVACCRTGNRRLFQGIVSDPIWPESGRNERDEVIRLTAEMSRRMEEIIRKFPDQYLWMHNRWKTYAAK
jgi:KDO2-lipid IV(A) lauroyltransferase